MWCRSTLALAILAVLVPGSLRGIEQRAVQDGVAVDLALEPLEGQGLREDQDVRVRL